MRADGPAARPPSAGGPAPGGPSAGGPSAGGPAPSLVLATFNLHAGVDGWGRPYDVLAACRDIDADVLVLEECWTPADPAEPGVAEPGLAEMVGAELGYEVHALSLSTGRRAGPHPQADDRWMRPLDWRGASHAIYLDQHRPITGSLALSARYREATPGSWGIAVLSRLPVRAHQPVDLGRLERDRARRAALLLRVDVGGRELAVVGTHMTHISYGSPLHFTRLRARLGPLVGKGPAVLAGDMNLWGPPVAALLPGWRRAVKGKTWPAWRPHSQVDHVLTRGPVAATEGEILPMAGSDHRPVRVRLAVGVGPG